MFTFPSWLCALKPLVPLHWGSSRSNLCVSLLACVVVTWPTAATMAASDKDDAWLEEVVVTAEFRQGNVADLPISATVLAPDDAGTTVQHLDEILSRAPNVNVASGASRARIIQIRGIGERGQFAEPLNSSVGLVVDGVDLSGIGGAATLFDVAQVEVLRGPQGTLYGANALAGLINVVTKQPTDTFSAGLRVDVGDYDARGLGGVVSGPLNDQLGYRISAQRYRDDGYMENRFIGRDDTNNRDESTYRGKLVWQGETAEMALTAGYVDIDNGYDAFSLDNNRNTLSDQPGRDQQQTSYVSVSLDTQLTEAVAFAAAVAFADSDIDYGYDEDWAFTGFDPIGYTSVDRYQRQRDTTTFDVRWLSTPGQGLAGGVWDWVVGIYALRQTVDLQRAYTFLPAAFNSSYDVDRYAVYAELSRPLGDTRRLTFGARYEQHQSDYRDSDLLSYSPEDDLIGGRLLLEQDLSSGDLVYFGVTQGYKSGGFNLDGSLAADLREFDPETLWNIEFGYKAELLDEQLSIRAALFRMQREDIQISTSTERPIPGSNAVQFIEYTGNAAEGFNQGVELEAQWRASQALTLFANVGLLDSEYKDYVDNSGRDLDGREQAHAPTYQFFAGLQYVFGSNWTMQLEVEGKDKFYFSDSHAAQSQSYELVNASLSYQRDRWSVRLWGRNLTDEDYFVRGFFFGNDPRDFYTARPFTQLGEPRQVGITFSTNW